MDFLKVGRLVSVASAEKPSPFKKPAPNPLLPFLVVLSGTIFGLNRLFHLVKVRAFCAQQSVAHLLTLACAKKTASLSA